MLGPAAVSQAWAGEGLEPPHLPLLKCHQLDPQSCTNPGGGENELI